MNVTEERLIEIMGDVNDELALKMADISLKTEMSDAESVAFMMDVLADAFLDGVRVTAFLFGEEGARNILKPVFASLHDGVDDAIKFGVMVDDEDRRSSTAAQ